MQPIQSASQSQLKRFFHEYKYLLIMIAGLAIACIAEPAAAQCLGWLCGPKNAITNNGVINGNNSATVFIEFIFLAIQVLILVGLGGLAVVFFFKMDRDENYVKPLVALLVALLLIFGTNFVAGYIVGDGNNAGTSASGNNNGANTTQSQPVRGATTVFN
ncbi:hypothetical protein [Acaryochloris marina]|uniref:Uncharacterized protein n=1 Tax=Acaryochloris marina (strain MBIC 11017) TaxID=329726 RepID=A8ZNE6_ACAM1|nr:hypothetical protein [Acaryochloris marina]ABW32532.1 hypothetical protein AM1_D0035 [Acaryochloris marina MBIC11017]